MNRKLLLTSVCKHYSRYNENAIEVSFERSKFIVDEDGFWGERAIFTCQLRNFLILEHCKSFLQPYLGLTIVALKDIILICDVCNVKSVRVRLWWVTDASKSFYEAAASEIYKGATTQRSYAYSLRPLRSSITCMSRKVCICKLTLLYNVWGGNFWK